MTTKKKIDIAKKIEVVMTKQEDRNSKPTVVRQMELSRRLEERGLIKKETYNVVRPMNARLSSN